MIVTVLLLLAVVESSVIIQSSFGLIYNQAPRLRIKGSGFPSDLRSLNLEISVPGEPSLILYTDYTLLKDPENEGIVLSLRPNKR